MRIRGAFPAVVPSALPASIALALLAFVVGCGGSGGGSNPAPPPAPDFSISLSPASVTLAPGNSQQVTVSTAALNGFSGKIDVAVSGSSKGVTISPASFSLEVGSAQKVTVSVATTVASGTSTISFSGSSASLSHAASLSLTVQVAVTSTYPPIATRFVRTDQPAVYDQNPGQFTAYDSKHNQFFSAGPTFNEVDVFDGTSESLTARLSVPEPWGLDVSPLDSSLWVATLIGDVYHFDTGTLKLITRYPASQIGNGFAASEVFALADGNLALLGGQYGIVGVDGAQSAASWSPTSNELKVLPVNSASCPVYNIGPFAVSADRNHILLTTIDEDGAGDALCSYNEATGAMIYVRSAAEFMRWLASAPNGNIFLFTAISGMYVYDQDLNLVGQVGAAYAPPSNAVGAVVSADGSTLYVSASGVGVYDTTTFAFKGNVQSFTLNGSAPLYLSAISSSGLLAGSYDNGVAFLDASQVFPPVNSYMASGFANPNTGPLAGGTVVSEFSAAPVSGSSNTGAWVGNVPAAGYTISSGNEGPTLTTPPATQGGPADLTMTFNDGEMVLVPDGFSYGPSIVEAVTNAGTADGGGQGVLVGYGFGTGVSDVQLSIGGANATVTAVAFAPEEPWAFPTQYMTYTIPPGTAGQTEDITVTTSNGSATAPAAFHYIPAAQSFAHSTPLQQGIYDPQRNLYYFTGRSRVEVFSPSSNSWQAPIPLAGTTSSSQLGAIAISPNSDLLAVSDFGGQAIEVVELSSPQTSSRFPMPIDYDGTSIIAPSGLAITNDGLVYFAVADIDGDGIQALYLLRVATGKISSLSNQISAAGNNDAYTRMLLTPDGARVWGNVDGITLYIDTASNKIYFAGPDDESGGEPDFAISDDGSTLNYEGILTDANGNTETSIAYNDYETWVPTAVLGQKLNQDGSLLYQPLTTGIYLLARDTGRLLYDVETPLTLYSGGYDATFLTGTSGVLGVITDNGIAFIDTSSLPIPNADMQPFPMIDKSAPPAVRRIPSFSKKPRLQHANWKQLSAGKHVKH
jgi:hypothetical protein